MRLDENNYVDQAERVILKLKDLKDFRGKDIPVVTTSKLRNLLAMTADIYNEVIVLKEDKLPEDIKGRINYLKIRFLYEAGREKGVKNLVKEAEILNHLDDIKGSRKQYLLFSRYMEALVAYRKFHVEKDD